MDNRELPQPSLAAIISALDATRTQIHSLQTALVGLALEAALTTREMAARLVESAALRPPPPLISREAVKTRHLEQSQALAAEIATLLRGGT